MDIQTLQKIRDAKLPDTEEGNIYAEMRKDLSYITKDFSDPSAISTTKVDVGSDPELKNIGVTKAMYEKYFGSSMRSEADSAQNLADYCAKHSAQGGNTDADKAKKLRLAKARSRAAKAKLALLEF